jgi:hypothetical protein
MTLRKPIPAERLSDLPNVSPTLAENLRLAGVPSGEALETIGAEAAWELLQLANFRPDSQTLFALEGAIERRVWHAVPPTRRFQLMHFLAEHAA